MKKLLFLFAFLIGSGTMSWATTYYISTTGSDSAAGSSGAPWATPNHAVNCGDVIIADAGTWSGSLANNFAANFGTVTGSGHCFAFLQCSSFDACYVTGSSSDNDGIWVQTSHWAVMGFEVQNINAISSGNASCFKASPMSAATITDVMFADDIANQCALGGFITAPYYEGGEYSVDYISLIADIAYDTAQGSNQCASGISIYEPVNSDTVAGTHIYISQYFGWGNVDNTACAGSTNTDGEGIILDTFSGSQSSFATPYTGQTAIENAISVYNGTYGVENYNNTSAPVYVEHVTASANGSSTYNSVYMSEFMDQFGTTPINNYGTYLYNIARTTRQYSGGGTNLFYAYSAGNSGPTTLMGHSWLYSPYSQNTNCWSNCWFLFGPSNVVGTDPAFTSAPGSTPSAPSCGSYSSVITCMAPLVADYTPTASGASSYGYQSPSTTDNFDNLFPQALCQYSSKLSGLVTLGCATEPGGMVMTGQVKLAGYSILGTYPTAAATPTFSPAGGTYSSTQSVTISTATSACSSDIWWNTTGSPSPTNGINGTSVTVSSSETVYAIVYGCPGYSNSAVGSAVYTISSGGGSWTVNTATCGVQAGSGAATCTWSTAIPAGSSIACGAFAYSSGVTYTVTDSASETYTSVGSQQTWSIGGSTAYGQVFWVAKTSTSITSETFTQSPSQSYPGIVCQAASDSGSSPAIDGSQCTGSSSTSTISCSSSLALSATDWVFAAGAAQGGAYLIAGSGFTFGSNPASNVASEYGLFSGSVTPSFGLSEESGGLIGVAFQP